MAAHAHLPSSPPQYLSFPLTRDPLSVLLSHLPTPHRLRLSRVCKQWRALAIEVTTSLKLYADPAAGHLPYNFDPHISLFPALTRLSIRFINCDSFSRYFHPLSVPTSLTSLRIKGSCAVPHPEPLLKAPFPVLTCLRSGTSGHSLTAVLHAAASVLTSLDLGARSVPDDELFCPSLTSLTIRATPFYAPGCIDLVRRHRTQLRHLVFIGIILRPLTEISLPSLTSLSFAGAAYTDFITTMAAHVHNFPALSSISLGCVQASRATPPPPKEALLLIAPLVTSLSHAAPTTEFYADLPLYTRLGCLRLPSVYQTYQYMQTHRTVSFPEIRFAPHKSTTPRFVRDFLQLAVDATWLLFEDEFSFAHLSSLTKPAHNVSLPGVRKLTIEGHFTPLQLAQVVCDFRRMAPALSRLHVRGIKATAEGMRALSRVCVGMTAVRVRLVPTEYTPELRAAVANNGVPRITLLMEYRTVKTPGV